MKRLTMALAGLLTLAMAGGLLAQEKGAGAPPATRPAANAQEAVLPEIDLAEVPLQRLIEMLGRLDRSFQTVVVRDPGVPAEQPIIQNLHVKNVTASRVLRIISESYPQVELATPDGPGPAIFIVKVRRPAEPLTPAAATGVYRLAEIVRAMQEHNRGVKGAETAPKEALNEILSAVKAMLALEEGQSPPVVQVHEDTQILFVKGSPAQLLAVSNLVQAMTVPRSQLMQAEQLRLADKERTLEMVAAAQRADAIMKELESMRAQLRQREQESVDKSAEIERLRVRLEAIQSGKAPEKKG